MDAEKGKLEVESQAFLQQHDDEQYSTVPPQPAHTRDGHRYRFWTSAIVNTISTAAIVFVNKRIFENAALRHAQVAFAAFHFTVTGLMMYIGCRPWVALFEPKHVSFRLILPLAIGQIFNVVLSNAALAYSSIQFYQVSRVLVTPGIVLVNYLSDRRTVPLRESLTLIAVCAGVAVLSYFDTQPAAGQAVRATTYLGVALACAAVTSTAVYTVCIKKSHGALECNSWQLVLNQAPVSVLMMLYIIPFSDDVTAWKKVDLPMWGLIGLSGMIACLINISQYIVVNEAGTVESSVLGHFKTCSIVALSWIVSQKTLTDGSVIGILLAIGGVISYSYVKHQASRN